MRVLTVASACAVILTATAHGGTKKNDGEPMPVPKPAVGADVVGTRMPLEDLRWLNTAGGKPVETEDRVTLVRWWTDTCPYCETSLPAISALEEQYKDRGFQTVAVYHPKPPRAVANETVLDASARFGYEGPVAADDEWAVLRLAYLDKGRRPATSVSFLLDGDGAIRYIHPGPELRPGKGRHESDLQAQYDEMHQAIEALLRETDAD